MLKLFKTSAVKTALTAIAIGVVVGVAARASAQVPGTKPDGVPLNLNRIDMLQAPPAGVAVKAGRMFDAKSGTMLQNQIILIQGDRIVDVGPNVAIPAGARVVDLSNGTVMPGLIDRHVHCFQVDGVNQARRALVGLSDCMRNLQGGFTTIQDMGSIDYSVVEVRDAINKGTIMGPRMQVAGPQVNPRAAQTYDAPSEWAPFGTGSSNWQLHSALNGPWAARAIIREHAHYGVDWIKIYLTEDFEGSGYPNPKPTVFSTAAFRSDGTMINAPSLTLEEAQALVDEAHRHGLKTITHSYGGEGLKIALQSGIDVVMHGAVGVTGVEGLDEETVRMYKLPLPNGGTRVAMYTLWDLIGGMEQGDLEASHGHTTRFKMTESAFKKLWAVGVPNVFGSGVGGLAHGTQVMQFPIYVKWGLTPAQAIQLATSMAAPSLNYDLGKNIGLIEKGRFADLVGVSGDPLADITTMMQIKFVMKGGTIYRDELTKGSPPAQKLFIGEK